jgi:hypothetical protein
MRGALEHLHYTFERDKEDKHYTRMMIVIPMPQFAYAFKFVIKEPAPFNVMLYDIRPTHSGILHMVEVNDITAENLGDVKRLLKRFAKDMNRKPYRFFFYDRIRTGLLTPEFLTARSKWRSMGVA